MARSYRVDVNIDDPSNAIWFQRSGQRDRNTFFPDTIYGEASFDLTVYYWHGDLNEDGTVPVETTPANFLATDDLTLYGRIEDQPSGVEPIELAVGSFTTGENSILFDVNAGVVPNEWSQVDLDTTNSIYPIAIWFTGNLEDDEITGKTNVAVIDKNHVGSGDALIIDASNLTYTPETPANWTVVPTLMNEGLDELAERVQAIEDNPSTGDMTKAVYDPQSVEGDAFDLANMTGLMTHDKISDFDAEVSANTDVTGSVTAHSDVSSAGRGSMITTAEGDTIASVDTHINNENNPHNVTPLQVGNTTPQWYASHIQSTPIDDPILATDQYVATWDSSTSTVKWVSPPGLGGGESNDIQIDPSATGQDLRITKTGSTIFIKGILGANNASVTTVGDDIVIDVVDSAENVRGAIAIANTATVTAGVDDTQAVTSSKLQAKLGDYSSRLITTNDTTGVYTMLQGDNDTAVFIDDTVTLPVLLAGTNFAIRNKSASQVTITLSGTNCANSTDLNIAGYGTVGVLYNTTTEVWIDGNLEA